MSQVYSDTSREEEPTALPDAEVFYRELSENTSDTVFWDEDDNEPYGEGWYYWYCLPECLPDSSPIGPFETEEELFLFFFSD